ncbi:hypothetical protein [Rhodobacter calidifons]|uniref:Uncharacterized protein n=1 Tax=Rhodobacter calidifons TaxID=2715277 RepID=A0ABX0G4Q3_9RHOB|nr:hypothetical protein [Rhodobacter calidifons]NHB75952.1 hypothetical protein [Rhodobacter calidifons]
MLWGKKVLRITAAIAVAALAAHTAESQKGQNAAQPLAATGIERLAAARPAATGAAAGAIPPSASLGASGDVAMGNLVGITPVAASIPATAGDQCRPALHLEAAPGAMILLTLTAPCNRSERIVVRHSGLSFATRTEAGGETRLLLPALKSDALVAVYLAGSRLVIGKVAVPDVTLYTRVAVTWEWPAEVELRATEGNRVLVAAAANPAGEPSRLMSFGAPDVQSPVMAHVYSVPGRDLGDVALSAELRITPASCGRTLRLGTIYAANGRTVVQEREVPVPLCGTAGDILLLKNLSPAPKLAAPK